MRSRLTILIIFILCSCNKDIVNPNQDIIGKWIWRVSYSSFGSEYVTDTTSKYYSIEFPDANNFTNITAVMGGPPNGNYEIKNLDGFKVLILKNQNYSPDTLRFSVTADSLILTETPNGYSSTTGGSWYHHFYKDPN